MAIKFFGQFLLDRRVISREQLLGAVQLQEKHNLPVGHFAVEMGYMSKEQADNVNRAQQITDRRFGELALKMELLKTEQIEEILERQHASRVRIGEALVRLGHLDDETLGTELETFREDQAPYQAGPVKLPSGTPESEFLETAIDFTEKLLLRMGGLLAKSGPAEPLDANSPDDDLISVRVAFSGALEADYIASVSKDVAVRVARRILGDGVAISDELSVDALKELCNTICGNVCSKSSQRGKPLEISPPADGAGRPWEGDPGIVVLMVLPDGRFELRIRLGT